MTDKVVLNASAVSIFSISSMFQSLPSKVNGVFGVYLAVALGFCVYHGVKCCQYFWSPSLQLDDRLKAVKCRMLFKEIQECLKTYSTKPTTLLEKECVALYNSMTKKDPIVAKGLFDCLMQRNMIEAYRFAQGFTSEELLFYAFEALSKAQLNDRGRLISLLDKAYDELIARKSTALPIDQVKHLLEYVKHAQARNFGIIRDRALERARDSATGCEDSLAKADAWREIANVCKELGIEWKNEQFESFLEQANNGCKDTECSKSDSLKAYLTLAKASKLCEEDYATPLGQARDLFVPETYQDADLLGSVYTELGFTGFAKGILDRAFEALKEQNSVTAFLKLANGYAKCGEKVEADEALNCAIRVIEDLPKNTDIEHKFRLFEQVSRCDALGDQALSVLQSLEKLYNECSDKLTKKEIARSIFELCEKKELVSEYDKIWHRCDFLEGATAVEKICVALTYSDSKLSLGIVDRTRLLKNAKILLLEVPSCDYVKSMSRVAESCLREGEFNYCNSLLNGYTSPQVGKNLIMAVIPLIALPIFRSHPIPGLVCLAAAYKIRNVLLL